MHFYVSHNSETLIYIWLIAAAPEPDVTEYAGSDVADTDAAAGELYVWGAGLFAIGCDERGHNEPAAVASGSRAAH